MKNLIPIFLLFFFSSSYAQSINANWKQDLNKELEEMLACQNTATTGVSPCNKYMGSALNTVYQINDFYSKEEGRHMLVNEIDYLLKNSSKWKLLGPAYDQKALREAQELANSKKAVVAVYMNEEGIGHVSVIVPGEMKPSGTWGFQVPNSVSFFPGDPSKSYIDKGLSYSFERAHIKSLKLYARNY